MPEEDIIRVLRLIEYEGPRSLVEEQVANSIHGTRMGLQKRGWPGPGIRITAVTIGTFPEIVEQARRVPDPKQITDLNNALELAQREARDATREREANHHDLTRKILTALNKQTVDLYDQQQHDALETILWGAKV